MPKRLNRAGSKCFLSFRFESFRFLGRDFALKGLVEGASKAVGIVMLIGFIFGTIRVVGGGFAIRRGDTSAGKLSVIGGSSLRARRKTKDVGQAACEVARLMMNARGMVVGIHPCEIRSVMGLSRSLTRDGILSSVFFLRH
jgi:hypothetical protein